jgi:hypothetical protein
LDTTAALEEKLEQYGHDDEMQTNDDFMTYREGKNPCMNDEHYHAYLQSTLEQSPKYDFLVIHDNIRTPARQSTPRAITACFGKCVGRLYSAE